MYVHCRYISSLTKQTEVPKSILIQYSLSDSLLIQSSLFFVLVSPKELKFGIRIGSFYGVDVQEGIFRCQPRAKITGAAFYYWRKLIFMVSL